MIARTFHWWQLLFHRPAAHDTPVPADMRDELLRRAHCAIRAGKLQWAQALVAELGEPAWLDAPCLNTLGLIAEARGQWLIARRRWSKALRRDPGYEPAHQNLRRYYELSRWGRSDCSVAFGDGSPADLPRTRSLHREH